MTNGSQMPYKNLLLFKVKLQYKVTQNECTVNNNAIRNVFENIQNISRCYENSFYLYTNLIIYIFIMKFYLKFALKTQIMSQVNWKNIEII